MKIGERIQHIRLLCGHKQGQFADHLGVSHPHISKVERGITNPSKQFLKAVCAIFNVNEDWLMSGIGEPLNDSKQVKKSNRKKIDTVEVKVWMLRNGITQTRIAADLHCSFTLVHMTLYGHKRSKRILGWFKKHGCPEELLPGGAKN